MECTDKNCSVHGTNIPRGKSFEGVVIASRAMKTSTIEWMWRRYVPKFERYEVKRSRVKAHNPECINAQPGDKVIIKECRPLSKTKFFVITEKVGKNFELLTKGEKDIKYEGKSKKKTDVKDEDKKGRKSEE